MKVALLCASLLLGLAVTAPSSQALKDVVIIGDTPDQQAQYQSYWQQLKDYRQQKSIQADTVNDPAPRPAQRTIQNLRVHNLKLYRTGARRRPVYRRPYRRIVRRRHYSPFYGYHRPIRRVYDPLLPYLVDSDLSRTTGPYRLTGILRNNNPYSVAINAVNYRVFDTFGQLVRTGSVQPEPRLVGPKQSVSLQDVITGLPIRGGYEVKLMNPAFVIGADSY